MEKARFSEKMCADRAHPSETVAERIGLICRRVRRINLPKATQI
jgi:hypothetical protein